jgi:hypothetical protein
MRALAWAVLIAVGCSADPCDGKGPLCISLRVEGSTPPLATLSTEASINHGDPLYLPVTDPNPYYLPVRFAVILPADTTGSVDLTVEGTDGEGRRYVDTGTMSVPPSGQDLTVKLVMTGPPAQGN